MVDSRDNVVVIDTGVDRVDSSYMIDSMVDSRDNVVVIDTGVDRVDSSYSSNSSVVVHERVSFSLRLSLTLAVHYIVVVGMRVDSRVGGVDTSYVSDSSMDSRHVVSDSVHKRT